MSAWIGGSGRGSWGEEPGVTEIISPASNVRVELRQESATSREPARAYIFFGERIIAIVEAKVENKMGADGGYYPCVTLTLEK